MRLEMRKSYTLNLSLHGNNNDPWGEKFKGVNNPGGEQSGG